MKTQIKDEKQGSALFTVMILIFTMTMLLGVVMSTAVQQSFMAGKLGNRVRALAIAEAGAHQAYSILSTNFAARYDPSLFPETSYGEGTYDVHVRPVTNNAAVITCTGVCEQATKVVILDIRNYGGTGGADWWNSDAFNYAIICGSKFDFKGCGYISGSNVVLYSNMDLDINGAAGSDLNLESHTKISVGNLTLNGSITSPSNDVHQNATITGGVVTAEVPLVEIPDIDLTPWYNEAAANGEVKTNWSTSSDYTPAGGIVWVEGDVNIASHAKIDGMIIATGDIVVSGAAEIGTTNSFCVASRDGSVYNTSSGTLKGLIYAKNGDYSQTANGNHEGQLIIKGMIDKGGNSDLMVYEQIIPTPPGGFPDSTDEVIGVSAWQQ
ncbi:MAG: pilus assembly PilX N-terminal domain-containing protein [Kiritimatiellia bacterium]